MRILPFFENSEAFRLAPSLKDKPPRPSDTPPMDGMKFRGG
ncbi:MAG: hypothetical protein ACK6DA_03650 [Candidatus Kapaibacterium sp.]